MNRPPANRRSRCARFVLAAVTCVLLASPAFAAPGARSIDGVWNELAPNVVQSGSLIYDFDSPGDYRVVQLDDLALFRVLRDAPMRFTPESITSDAILSLPMPDGTFARFRVSEAPVLSPKLSSEYPEIRSYSAQGLDNPAHSARFARGPLGFYGVVVTPEDLVLIERARTGGDDVYISFYRKDLPAADGITCTADDESGAKIEAPTLLAPPSGANLRTYNLALVATAEFRNTLGTALATTNQFNNYITAVNALYEAEVAISFTIVCTSVGYTNTGTDPFTNPETVDGTLLNQADATLDADCPGGYQIGHLIHHRAGGGNSFAGRAGGSVVCQGDAGRAASTGTNVNSSLWTVDLLPHEMGHQFSAGHTYNSTAGGCVERSATNAYEIGSGSTIMSYACANCTGEDANGNGCADAYFHTRSFDQITNYREAGGNCGAQTATGNTAPGVNAGGDFTIPRGTPFALTATGSDANGDALTWCWEQFDLGAASPPLGGNGPLFRSFLPTPSATRTFPNLADLLAGNPTPFEILPTTDRTLTFRATARDGRANGGGVNYDTAVLTVSGDPFFVTAPNGGEALKAGCSANVTWTVGGGSVATNVNVYVSIDGGLTWPYLVAGNVANDGSQSVVLPCVASTEADARVKVEAVGNVFFDVSNGNFTITPEAPVASITAPTEVNVGPACSVDIPVSGSVIDDCSVQAGDVKIAATSLGGTATVVASITAVQNGAGRVDFSGTVTVSDLSSCPSVMRLEVTGADGCGLEGSTFADVTVLDPTPPEITVTLNREYLWPPNHKLVDIEVDVTVTDNCPNPSFVLTSITSNEPDDDLGDGNTAPDIVGAAIGKDDTEFQLRSERMGPGTGRIYTIVYTASDNCGNTDAAEVEVRVEHDQSGHALVVAVNGGNSGLGDDYLAVVVPAARPAVVGEEDLLSPVERGVAAPRRTATITDLLVGNTADVLGSARLSYVDIDGDGLRDAVAMYPLGKVEAIRAASSPLDGPIGLHYANDLGESFLVADLLSLPQSDLRSALGEAVSTALGDDLTNANAPEVKTETTAAPAPGGIVEGAAPAITRLAGFRPNPFLARTAVSFELARPSRVTVGVYAPNGTRIRALADLAFDPGRHAVSWDGRDDAGQRVAPGVYFVRFAADGVVETGKALLLP